jgi:hypothetical protein
VRAGKAAGWRGHSDRPTPLLWLSPCACGSVERSNLHLVDLHSHTNDGRVSSRSMRLLVGELY